MAVNLDNLLRAMHNAVIEAQQLTQEQHLRMLNRFFEKNDDTNEFGNPKMLKINLPFAKSNSVEYREVEIPLIALTPPSSIKIKNMKVEFDAKITGFEDSEKSKKGFHISDLFKKKEETEVEVKDLHRGPIKLNLDSNKSGTLAKIQIEFTSDDIPETVARINDHIIKSFPF